MDCQAPHVPCCFRMQSSHLGSSSLASTYLPIMGQAKRGGYASPNIRLEIGLSAPLGCSDCPSASVSKRALTAKARLRFGYCLWCALMRIKALSDGLKAMGLFLAVAFTSPRECTSMWNVHLRFGVRQTHTRGSVSLNLERRGTIHYI